MKIESYVQEWRIPYKKVVDSINIHYHGYLKRVAYCDNKDRIENIYAMFVLNSHKTMRNFTMNRLRNRAYRCGACGEVHHTNRKMTLMITNI